MFNTRSQLPAVYAVGIVLVTALFVSGCKELPRTPRKTEQVGRIATNRFLLPTGQILTPAGRQIELPRMRPQVLALSPDGKMLVTAGKESILVVIDAATGKVRQRVPLSTNQAEVKLDTDQTESEDPALKSEASAPQSTSGSRSNAPAPPSAVPSLTGLAFAPDGRYIYLSTVRGSVRAFPVDPRQVVGKPVSIQIPGPSANTNAGRGFGPGFGAGGGTNSGRGFGSGGGFRRPSDIPTGLAVSADSQRLYVAGSVANRLHELEAATGKVLRSWDTGVAPHDVALAAGKVYVSNLGGGRPGTNDLSAPAGRNTRVRVDELRAIPNEGSVTIIDVATGTVKTEILVGLHPSALAVSPDQKYVVAANTGSDTLSVIDTQTDCLIEKIWTRQTPADPFGAQPNALVFDSKGERLYVCNGTQNAIAVIDFLPRKNDSKVVGLIPVGWFPGAIAFDAERNSLCVANIKGLGALKNFKADEKVKLNTKDFHGCVSLVPVPGQRALAAMSKRAQQNMRYPKVREALLPARPGQPARAVPERVGEPSLFEHVIYVIKENRTYDQVLGDMKEGKGDTNLCTFGEKYTPNQHKIAREFVLLDNTYCAGVQSADGHQWTDSAIANEYVERQLSAGFPRSYPGAKEADSADALAWASSGFIWDNALAHGKTFRNYGEWMISQSGWRDRSRRSRISWRDFWNDYAYGSNHTRMASRPGIETLRKFSPTNTAGWDLHVLDVMRADFFIKELKQFETNGGFPNLTILFLPNDHTGGTRGRYPHPGAQVADNDLAFGRVVEAVSHSKFWPTTCIFAIEDDPQAGWDHVSGYRTTCYVVSPYSKRKRTVSKHYNQLSVIRTMELILGLPPMNQMDASATAMHECFTATCDLTPFISVRNQVPLDQINPEPRRIADPLLRKDALVSASLPLDAMDQCPEDVLNRILWRAMKGTAVPYPEWAVKPVKDDD